MSTGAARNAERGQAGGARRVGPAAPVPGSAEDAGRLGQAGRVRWVKRAVDIVVGTLALAALSPLLLLAAVAIRLTSPGPIFYRWRVIGRGGRPCGGSKLRSMVGGAEDQKPTLMPCNEMTGPGFKMRDDPRVTRVGRFIRKYSLDEMPQLWSVIKGDMSLVGPRPVAPHEWERFEPWQRRKLSVTPGMICLWHVEGKPLLFEQWIKLDLEYIDRWSPWLDVKILLRGIGYILGGRSF